MKRLGHIRPSLDNQSSYKNGFLCNKILDFGSVIFSAGFQNEHQNRFRGAYGLNGCGREG